MLEQGGALHLATEIQKPEGWIYCQQWPQSGEGLILDDENTQEVLTANMFDKK